MEEQKYVVVSEYEGSYVGTLEEIVIWSSDNGVLLQNCTFYEVGVEVKLKHILGEIKC